MITVRANARNATYISDDLITSGSVGIPVTFVLSEDFNGLSAIAVFEGSGTARDVALMGDSCVVPHEVLATAGGYLRIGIYASNADGTIVIPTVWAGSKLILQGTEPSEVDPSAPTPSWAAQVQEAAAEALANSEEAIEIAGGADAAAEEARQSASAAAGSATDAGQFASAAGTAQTAAEAAQTAATSARDAAVAAQGSAESSAQAAAGSATEAAGSAEAAAASEAAAREVQESIPADYTDLSNDVSELKSQSPKVVDSDATGIDLDISDGNGNVLARFANGDIQTKKFDSAKTLNEAESDAVDPDLDISDPQGNVLLRLRDGGIFTKFFKSAPKVITLKADGTGDFSTLRAAVDSITDANSETNPYEIHVYPGTYDTLEGYTDAEIRAADIGGGYTDQSMVGVKLTDGINLIGIGNPETIILTAELSTTDYPLAVRGNISTLNLKGTCRIENLTIKATSLRYCVHDDFEFPTRYTRIVRNCVFVPIGRTLSYNPATTYGAGIRIAGCDALFENCDFGYNFGMHTRGAMTGDSLVVFNHCRGLNMRIGDAANDSDVAKHTFVLNGCDIKAVSINRNTTTIPHVFVSGVNNHDPMCFCDAADHPHIVDCIKTYPSALPIGTLVSIPDGTITANSGGITAVAASDIYSAIGVIVDKDDVFDYIQTDGYINAARLGITGLSVGDYITVDSNMMLVGGGTESNAVGVVRYTDTSNNAQIKLRMR